ncbi:MAG: LysE family translocator [Dehalococcoidia bacterium]
MVDGERLAAFALVAFGIIAVPGPSVLFVVSRGVALGRRAAVASALGNDAGLLVQVVAVAFGLGAIVTESAAVFTAVKLAGAVYLIYLGVQAIRHRSALASVLEGTVPARTGRVVREGFIVGATNPKAALLFTAILPQFVDPSRGHVPVQMLIFGLVAVSIAVVCDTTWGLLAGTARAWLGRSRRRLDLLGGAGGVIMVGLGVRLAFTGRHD